MIRTILTCAVLATLGSLACVTPTSAHPGGTDARGCHIDAGTGRHCHNNGRRVSFSDVAKSNAVKRNLPAGVSGSAGAEDGNEIWLYPNPGYVVPEQGCKAATHEGALACLDTPEDPDGRS